MNWKIYFVASPITPSYVLSQFLWYNSYIKIDNKAVYLEISSTKNINFIAQLLNTDESVKKQNILKTEFALQNKAQFCWLQLGVLNFNGLMKNFTKVKKLERKIAFVCEKKTIQFNNKWKSIDSKITV